MDKKEAKIREWTSRLDRYRRSGATLTQFCRDEKISIQTYYYWRSRIQGNAVSKASTSAPGSNVGVASSNLRFTIQAGAIKIECHSDSIQAIEVLLSWVARNQSVGFQQLVVSGCRSINCFKGGDPVCPTGASKLGLIGRSVVLRPMRRNLGQW